jgi:hypothetical protein
MGRATFNWWPTARGGRGGVSTEDVVLGALASLLSPSLASLPSLSAVLAIEELFFAGLL